MAITLNVPADVLLGINQDATQEYALDRLTGRILQAVASQTDKQKRALLEVVEAFA